MASLIFSRTLHTMPSLFRRQVLASSILNFNYRTLSTLTFSKRFQIASDSRVKNNLIYWDKKGRLRLFSSGGLVDIPLPSLADSIDTGTLASWEKNVGDYCAADEVIAILDTDKVSVDVKAPVGGELVETLAKEGQELKVGDIIARLMPKEAPAANVNAEKKEAKPEKKEIKEEKKEKVAASPKPVAPPQEVKPAAKVGKKEEDPTGLGVSKKPSVMKRDSIELQENTLQMFPLRGTKVVKMTPIRKKTAQRLKESQNTNAQLTTFNEVDMTNLFKLRNTYKDAFLEKHGVKLGFMSAFVVAAVKALQELPVVNAKIDGDNIVYHDFIDISVAVSSPRGLVVPVIRNAEKMGFKEIESEIMSLATKARDNKLTLEEMSGGTFTITNGGVFGSMMSTPLINMPQSAILGMHATKDRAVAVDGKVEIRPMMYLALSYDHRIIDGRESVTFLKSLKEKIEDPTRLLLNL